MKYRVILSRIGTVDVDAKSLTEAMRIANSLKTNDIKWADDWIATDVLEESDICDVQGSVSDDDQAAGERT